MNVKVNKVIGQLKEVDDLYVFPSCGDETNCIGAAWSYLEDQGLSEQIKPIGPFYLGPAPTNPVTDAALAFARSRGLTVERPEDIAESASHLLVNGEIVARLDGAEEFGARALGNRSVLADPQHYGVVDDA